MTFTISFLCFFAVLICASSAETKIPIGMIYDYEDELTLKSFEEAIAAITGHDPTFELFPERVNGANQYEVIQAATSLLEKNVLSIVVPSTRGGFSSLISMSSSVQVPLISLSDKSVDEEGQFLINVGPNNIRAILDVMRFYRWHNVVYFYDKEDGPSRLQNLLRIGSGALKLNVLGMHKLERAEMAAPYLRKAEIDNPNTIINVALDLKPSLASKLLNLHAKAPSTSKKNIHFLMVEPVDEDFFSNNRDLRRLNVTALSVYNPQSPVVAEKLKNIDIRSISSREDAKTKILLASDTADLLDEAFSRLLQKRPEILDPLPTYFKDGASKFTNGPLVKQYIAETYVAEGFTGPIQLDQNGQRRGMTVYLKESTPTDSTDAFTWTDQKGLIPVSPAYAMEKNALSEKKSLVVSVVLGNPYLMLNPDPKATGNDRYEGYSKDLMDLIAAELNIEYEIKLSSDGRYGTRDSISGKWNGMIGELLNHEADMAVADLTITSVRQEVVDFSVPYMTVGITMLIKKPGGDGTEHGPSASSYFFLHIFTMDVWGCILVSFIGVGVLYFFVTKLTSVYIDPRTGAKRHVSIFDSLWFSFGSLLLHNTGIYPRSISSRFLTAIWWLFVIFIATLYVSGLVSMLLVELFGSGSWNNYKALSSKTTYSVIQESLRTGIPEIGCVEGGSTRAFFRNAKNSVYMELNEVLNKNPSFLGKGNSDGVERVRNGGGKYAFLMESSTAHYVSFKTCDVAVVSQQLDSKGYGIAFNKGSPYKAVVDRVLLRLMEAGELQNLYLKWWIDGSPCFKKQERSYMDLYHTALTLSNVGGLFYCLITGVVLTLFITAIEYCVKRRRRGHHSVALTQISKGEAGDLNGDHEINHSVL